MPIIVLAKITFSDKLPEPKKSPGFPKMFYPIFKIRNDGTITSGRMELVNVNSAERGETVTAKITFINSAGLERWVYPGKEFSFYSGKLLLGEGEVISLVTEP